MRSAVFNQFGDPTEVLKMEERPLPEPGPGEIRVKMSLSPIHNHDLWTIRGSYGIKPALPAIGGSEAAGTVEKLGSGITNPKVGQRIVATGVQGAWAEYFIATAAKVVPLPDAISDEVGSQLIAMPLSALMLLEDLDIKPGQWMIQNAATGAVAKTLSLIAKDRGIHVINLVRRPEAVNELSELGITDGISTSDPNWRTQVKDITKGEPILRAVDSVGGEESGELLKLLGEYGMLITFGSMTGKSMVINSGDVIFKQATIKGFWAAKRKSEPTETVRMIGELIRLAVSGTLKLPVEKIFDLDSASEAARASTQPGRKGKISLRGAKA